MLQVDKRGASYVHWGKPIPLSAYYGGGVIFWSRATAATLFHPSPISSECACKFSGCLVQGNLRCQAICAIFGMSLTWSVEADPEQTCCSSSFQTIGNQYLSMEHGLLSIARMIWCFYLGLLYLSNYVEIDVFCSMALGPVIPFTACKKLFLWSPICHLSTAKGISFAHLHGLEFC